MDGVADIVFAFFAVAWIPTRHGIFFYLFYQYNRGKLFVTPENPYDPTIGAYLSVSTINYFLIVLGLFQCLLCIWLKDIIIAVHKALTSSENLEDHRSDSDDYEIQKSAGSVVRFDVIFSVKLVTTAKGTKENGCIKI